MASKKKKAAADLAELVDVKGTRQTAMDNVVRQLRTVARVTLIALVVIWLLALGFWTGLESEIPLWIAGGLTLTAAVAAGLIYRNYNKSRELGLMMGEGGGEADMGKLDARVDKGDAAAILTRAQMEMQSDPKKALATLERAPLEKTQKVMANQIRATRAMIHLNQAEVKAARALAEDIDLAKAPDARSKANLAGVVAEAWARSGNSIEASELLDGFDPEDGDMDDVKIQLYRARAFAEAHRNRLPSMRKALKELEAVSPQLLAVFVGQKRVHPVLMKEARKRLEKSGLIPRQRIQGR